MHMIKILKYPIKTTGITKLRMPYNARIKACAQDYNNQCYVYAELFDTAGHDIDTYILSLATEQAIALKDWIEFYIGTIMNKDGYEIHVYELIQEDENE